VAHLLGGWTIAPVFTAGSGLPIALGTINGGGQAFGEGDSANFFGYGESENAIPMSPGVCSGNSSDYNVSGSNGIGTSGYGVNMFADPALAYNSIRQPILGYDTHDGGYGVCCGLPYWNVDMSVKKMFKITERVRTEFQMVFTHIFNHNQWGDVGGDYLDTSNPAASGALPGSVTVGNTSFMRQMEFGLRIRF